jgi:nucleotide-binding universal stress UspA family protein
LDRKGPILDALGATDEIALALRVSIGWSGAMELRDILVGLDPTDAGEARLRLAAAIACGCGAVLSAAYVMPEAIPDVPLLGGGLTVVPPTVEAFRPIAPAGESASPASGETAEAGRGPAVAAIVEERFRQAALPLAQRGDFHLFGLADGGELAALARTVDLVIYGQQSPEWRLPTGFRPEDLIVAGGRPLLVVPYAGKFDRVGQRVLIAWDGTREAARAVHDALPLIGKAEAVTIMTVRDHEADFERDAPTLARLVQHLDRHGIKANRERSVRGAVPVADLLLSRASDLDIDLIVAGAYHHSQFREALIGGVSRELLDHMTVPVLLAH